MSNPIAKAVYDFNGLNLSQMQESAALHYILGGIQVVGFDEKSIAAVIAKAGEYAAAVSNSTP